MGNRLDYLDISKALAAFLVCFYHFVGAYGGGGIDMGTFENGVYQPTFSKFLYGFCAVSVPLFFVVSGQSMLMKERTPRQNFKTAARLLLIYLFWGAVCSCAIKGMREMPVTWSTLWEAAGYLWYLETLAFLYLMNIAWQRCKKYKYTRLLPLLFLAFPFCTNLLFTVLQYMDSSMAVPAWGHTGVFRLYSIVYVFLPFAVKKLKGWIAFLSIACGMCLVFFEVMAFSNATGIVYDGVNACFPTVGALLMVCGVFHLIKRYAGILPSGIKNTFMLCGRYSLGIYLFHMPFIVLYKHVLHIAPTGWLGSIIYVLSIMTLCILLASLYKRTPYVNQLV